MLRGYPMNGWKRFFLTLCLLPCNAALGRAEAPKYPLTVKQILDKNVRAAEQMVSAAAEAMPEESYAFAPTNGEFKGVRTFAQMVKHVAVVNFVNAAAILGEKTPVDVGESENGSDSVRTKTQILKFLKDSFAYLDKATDTLDEKNLMTPTKDPWSGTQVPRLMFVTTGISHPWEMYGQMAIYLRLNGIDPNGNRGHMHD
jgi:DinB superfamily